MKKTAWVLIASMMLLPAPSFAQTNSQTTTPAAAWSAFIQQEEAKRKALPPIADKGSYAKRETQARHAFFKQRKADIEAFFKAHPDVKAYIDKLRAEIKAQASKRNKNST
jgi:hypothetical protein